MQTHISPNDPLAIRLIEKFFDGQTAISVPIEGKMKSGQCYANVIDHIRRYGGRMQLGWLLTIEPSMYVEATHHAVWCDNDNRMIDITDAAFPGMNNTQSTFVVDNDTPVPTDYWHSAKPSEFLCLNNSAKVATYIAITRKIVVINGKLSELARRAGGKLMRLSDGNVALELSCTVGSPIHLLNEEVRFLRDQKMKLRGELDREAV